MLRRSRSVIISSASTCALRRDLRERVRRSVALGVDNPWGRGGTSPRPLPVSARLGRWVSGICGVMLLWGCEEKREGGEERSARPAVVQVGSAEGPLMDEDEACQRMHAALSEALEDLSCGDLDLPDCPALIRPAGSTACTRFSENSVQGCEEAISGYDSCDDFVVRRCFVVSLLDEVSEGCVPPDAGAGTPVPDASVGADAQTDAASDSGADATDGDSESTPSDGGEAPPDVDDVTDASLEDGGGDASLPELGGDAGDSELPDAATSGSTDSGAEALDAGPDAQ